MFDPQYAGDNPGPYRLIIAIVIVAWVWGCSTMGTPSVESDWVCDGEADAAVDRQDWEQAFVRHQAFLIKEPGNCLAMYHLGYILGKMGDRTQEANQYERAVQCGLDKDDLLFFNLGMAYSEMNLMEKALASFEQAVTLNPNNADHFFGLGLAAQADGQSQRAQTALIKAVKVNPHHWEARILLTRIYLDSGRLAAAQNHLEALRESIPDNEEVVELWQTYEDRSITTFEPQSW